MSLSVYCISELNESFLIRVDHVLFYYTLEESMISSVRISWIVRVYEVRIVERIDKYFHAENFCKHKLLFPQLPRDSFLTRFHCPSETTIFIVRQKKEDQEGFGRAQLTDVIHTLICINSCHYGANLH